jgi:hypothetical protein
VKHFLASFSAQISSKEALAVLLQADGSLTIAPVAPCHVCSFCCLGELIVELSAILIAKLLLSLFEVLVEGIKVLMSFPPTVCSFELIEPNEGDAPHLQFARKNSQGLTNIKGVRPEDAIKFMLEKLGWTDFVEGG